MGNSMSSVIPLLSNVNVAAPCRAAWDDMEAVEGDLVHFCAGCKKRVMGAPTFGSTITRETAEAILKLPSGPPATNQVKNKGSEYASPK
jgi:predicted fused transcriptional regulator/phosphomethylpyrimidine kinase